MAMSQADKAQSHHRIVKSAARLVREQGIDATGVVEVMKDAGLTHGGFYKHFADKEALILAAIEAAFSEVLTQQFGHKPPPQELADYRENYVSQEHIDTPGQGCPIAALSTDVSRSTHSLKAAFGRGVRATLDALAEGMSGNAEDASMAAVRELSLLVGAITIARACDPETSAIFQKAISVTESETRARTTTDRMR